MITLTVLAGPVPIETRNVRDVLGRLASDSGIKLHLTDEGTIAFGMDVSPLDRRALAVDYTVARGLFRLATSDENAALVQWLGAQLARRLGATADSKEPATIEQVMARIEAHEDDLVANEPPRLHEPDEDLEAVFALVRLGRIALVPGGEADLTVLVRSQPSALQLYESLLEHEAIDDVFLSESEFLAALGARPPR